MVERKEKSGEIYYRRFGAYRILEHWVLMITFFTLVITGLPQRFHEYEISRQIISALGGIVNVRVIHRTTGVIFTLLAVEHILVAFIGMVFKKWNASMMVTVKDFYDTVDNIKYYLGMRDIPALCDRYDYRQKFEYWGVVLGGILMIVTGFILWYPTFFTKFLPGQVVPAAKAAHQNEALLAFLVIVVWHMYNSIFNPEVFPLDTTIFTGWIPRELLLHEHPLELARIEGKTVDEIIEELKSLHVSHVSHGEKG